MAPNPATGHAAELDRRGNWEAPLSASSFEATGRAPRSKTGRALRRIGWNLLPPLTFVAIVAVWALAVRTFSIPAYLLPGPGAVFSRLVAEAPMLSDYSMVTLTEILLGFGLTVVTAIPLGLVIALSLLAKQILYPPIMLLQLVPKIAVAPLFLVWLGANRFPEYAAFAYPLAVLGALAVYAGCVDFGGRMLERREAEVLEKLVDDRPV